MEYKKCIFYKEIYNGEDIKNEIEYLANEQLDKEMIKFINNMKIVFEKLYEKENYLIHNISYENGDNHVGERAIVHHFAKYFEQYFKKKSEWKNYDYDCEYNRNGYDPKKLGALGVSIPDFIVHKRGNNDFNKIVFEFKTWWNEKNLEDLLKVYSFVKSNIYQYKIGISVVLYKESVDLYIIYRKYDSLYGIKTTISI